MKNSLLYLLFLLVLISCKESNSFEIIAKNNIYLKDSAKNIARSSIKICEIDGIAYLHYFNSLDSNIIIYNTNNEIYDSIDASSIFQFGTINKSFDYYLVNIDSIFFLLDNNTICLLKDQGQGLECWNINYSINGYEKQYLLLGLGEHCPIRFREGFLYVRVISTKYHLRDPINITKFYSLEPFLRISLHVENSSSVTLLGNYPKNMKKGKFMGVTEPILHFDWNKNIVISYPSDENLEIISNQGIEFQKCTFKNYEKSIPYPEDSSWTNHSYYRKFLLAQNEFRAFSIDNSNRLIYRIYFQGIPYIKNQFEVNTPANKPWTLLIYNQNYDLIYQKTFNDCKEYSPSSILPFKNGLLIRNNLLSDEHTVLTYFQFN